jgi:hypothetical protein
MIEINENKYVFVPDYEVWGEGSLAKAQRHLCYIDTPQEFCDKIAAANSSSACYRVENKEWGPYFNTSVRTKDEIFVPLCEKYHDLGEQYGLNWFLMPWGSVYIHACGASPNDSYYYSYGWYKLESMDELRMLLLGKHLMTT